MGPWHVELGLCLGGPPRDPRSRSSDREVPQFKPRIPHGQGAGIRHGTDACPNCGVLTLDGVVGAPWTMGMGQHLGRQVWTEQDKQDKPQNA